MAKTFKNLPLSSETKASRPTSERDFFDLSDDIQKDKKAAEKPQLEAHIDNTSISDNTSNTSNTGNKKKSKREAADSNVSVNDDIASASGVRQTFVLSVSHLERLRDYVHARRVKGEYNYSQKQAMQEALDLLFATVDSVPPRPAQVRERQQQHSQRIRQGRQAGTNE